MFGYTVVKVRVRTRLYCFRRLIGWAGMNKLNGRHFAIAVLGIVLTALCGLPSRAGTTGSILGTVTDDGGHAIAGVTITVAAPSGHFTTATATNGFYSLNGLPLDTYVVTFSKDGFQTQTLPGITVIQDQPYRLNAHLSTGPKSLGRITVRGTTSLVQPTVTADTYVVNQQRLSDINGTPQDLNGFQAFNSLPGVTTDNFGYPTIRAGAENDIGYQLDGVDNTDAVTGQFLNAVSLNGARSVQLSTGGYDVSNGNTNSGVINEVVRRGTYPAEGQATFRVISPTYGHEITFDYGGATPNNRFSYYLSYGGQRDASDYGDRATLLPLQIGNTVFSTLNDEVLNLFYHFGDDNKNELQFLTNESGQTFTFNYLAFPPVAPYASNNGNVQFSSDPFGLCTASFSPPFPPCNPAVLESNYLTLFPSQVGYQQNVNTADTQSYNSVIDKLNFKRQLTPSSFAEVRLFKTSENLIFWYPYDVGSFSDFYEDLQTTNLGEAFDYSNQISSKNEIGFGGDGSYFNNRFFAAFPSFEPFDEPLETLGCASAANTLGSQQAGGCYIAPFNAALNAAGATTTPLPTDPGHAPLTTFINDFSYTNDPLHRWDLWLKDRWQPNERLTLTLGLRWDKESIPLPPNAGALNTTYFIDDTTPTGCGAPPATTPCNIVTVPGKAIGTNVTQPSQTSPRLAASWELGARDTLRFSFGENVEFVPLSAIENTYQVNPALQNCSLASGCFVALPGYSPTCVNGADPAHGNTSCNNVTNLYQQAIIDLNTNNFAQYTPVLPQTAVNYDFSIEHDFGEGIELRITPYYRKGFNYVVGNQPLLFLLRSGTPVFGPLKEENAGVNQNTGVEFALQRNAPYGFSGLLDATYDNTLANYDSDFFPTVNNAALAANHFYHVTYVSPVVGTLNLVYNARSGFHAATTVSYNAGYPYGVGKKTFVFDPNGLPVQVPNTDLANGGNLGASYYATNPSNPGTQFAPNIVASRGTPEGDDPGTLRSPATTIVNLTLSHDIGNGSHHAQVGVRAGNLFGDYSPTRIPANPYYGFNGFGNFGFPSGVNPNACAPGQNFACEPFQYNYSGLPYEKELSGPPREYTFFVSVKY